MGNWIVLFVILALVCFLLGHSAFWSLVKLLIVVLLIVWVLRRLGVLPPDRS